MNTFALLSVIVGISLYIPLCIHLLKGSVTQNISSYILWLLLDVITAAAMWVDGGNYALPAAYGVGCFMVCLCIWKSRRFSWTWFETTIAGLVVLCVIVWWLTEASWATITGTIAGLTAGIPMIRHAYRRPHEQPMLTFWGYCLANLLGIFAGNGWSIQERFYPTACFIFTVVNISITLWRRRSVKMIPAPAVT